VRPPVSMTTADGDWHTAMTLGASPYLLVRLVYPVEFLALAVDVASSHGYRLGAGDIIHTRSDLAAGIEIRLRATGSRVQLPERQKISLFPHDGQNASGHTQPSLRHLLGFFPKSKTSRHEVEHSTSCHAQTKDEWGHTSTPPTCLRGVAVSTARFSSPTSLP
jgi:hypothetical protein